ncbi:NADPH-dependent F420 reductase [Nitriliruptoraceae bacterium ZYF776]|nr:NADPH-dependent F420 reductase [Profundirhabdus halotolerans]
MDEATIGILGGTGALGAGLALRWAAAGRPVVIGSRDADRATARAEELRGQLPETAGSLTGAENSRAAEAGTVVVSVPFASAAATVDGVADRLQDTVLVSAVVPLAFDGGGPHVAVVDGAGSAAELLAERAPEARVVGAFHSVAAAALADLSTPLEDDVLLCGDDDAAVDHVAELVRDLDGAHPVPAGALRLAGPIEGLTAVLIGVNKRHRAHVGLRLTRLPRD